MYITCFPALWGSGGQFALHGLSCKKSQELYFRHAAVNNIIMRSLGASKFPAQLEPSTISRSYSKRPIRLEPTSHLGRILVWE